MCEVYDNNDEDDDTELRTGFHLSLISDVVHESDSVLESILRTRTRSTRTGVLFKDSDSDSDAKD